jgi:hypothetical protein
MLFRVLACLLLCATALAQTVKPAQGSKADAPEAATSEQKTATTGSAKDASPTVVTIQGLCSEKKSVKRTSAGQKECKTVITRADLEKAIHAVQPEMPASARKRFADSYAMGLVMAHAAHEKGLDHGPTFEEMMRLMRVQVMAQEFSRSVRDEASHVPEKDIQAYYDKNPENYQEADLERIYIPKVKQLPPKENQNPADAKKERDESEGTMRKEADDLHARAVKGEDFGKLQSEAFETAGMKIQSPATKLSKVKAASFPPEQRGIFSLKPGSVSDLITSAGGYFIYKLDAKTTLPLSAVRDDIRNLLESQNYQQTMQALQHSVQLSFDEDYFKNTSAPAQNAMKAPGTSAGSPRHN